MEKISLSVALIRKTYNQNVRWLARLDPLASKLVIPIGPRLERESFRDTAIREVAWEFRLDRQRDFLVSSMAQKNLEFIDRIPGRAEKSHLRVSFYNVEVYLKKVVETLEKDRQNFWVTSEEICNGRTRGGRPFDPMIPYLVNRSRVIQFWESSSGN